MRFFLILVGVRALVQGVGMFLSSRCKESDPEARDLVGIVDVVLALVGLIPVHWPNTGIFTVSWLLAGLAVVIGSVRVYVATRLRGVWRRVGDGS